MNGTAEIAPNQKGRATPTSVAPAFELAQKGLRT